MYEYVNTVMLHVKPVVFKTGSYKALLGKGHRYEMSECFENFQYITNNADDTQVLR